MAGHHKTIANLMSALFPASAVLKNVPWNEGFRIISYVNFTYWYTYLSFLIASFAMSTEMSIWKTNLTIVPLNKDVSG